MKRIFIILYIITPIFSFANDSTFIQANKEYQAQNYLKASLLYESIISDSLESAELYHNLGNCYYKQQKWADAIWYYEKSLKYRSSLETSANLKLSRSNIIDKIQPIPKIFYKTWWDNIVTSLQTKSWQIITIAYIWILLILIFINKKLNYRGKIPLKGLAFLAIFLFLITYSSYEKGDNTKEAIIFPSIVQVNSAPTKNSKNIFSLHSGAKVTILDNINNWIKIEIADGKNGWIKKSNCKIIN